MKDNEFFTITEEQGNFRLKKPGGGSFFSIGLNHIDFSPLCYPDNVHLWREKYLCDRLKWIREAVVPDLRQWGFNTIGWVQEVVVRGEDIHRHSSNWTEMEYRESGMPYCHMLPFSEIHQWEVETKHPDVFSKGFEEWCDYVARSQCVNLADDPNLIGYFFSDCPNWVHPTINPKLKGPWFDPVLLKSAAGRKAFCSGVERYYRGVTQAVRRYDEKHLILGDRFDGKKPIPDEVLKIASKYTDALSFQYFARRDSLSRDFKRWHEITGLPLLLADYYPPKEEASSAPAIGKVYGETLEKMFELGFVLGVHLCGAYLENKVRKRGLRDRNGRVSREMVTGLEAKNLELGSRQPEKK